MQICIKEELNAEKTAIETSKGSNLLLPNYHQPKKTTFYHIFFDGKKDKSTHKIQLYRERILTPCPFYKCKFH